MQNRLVDNGRSLLDFMMARAAAKRQPARGIFELTSRCNLSCGMCYIRKAASDRMESSRELPAEAWLSLARQAVDNGMVFLLLTGGEVFLKPDFFAIYEPLTSFGIQITIFTNGTLITSEIARRIAKSPPARIEITLYGSSAETYESITGIPGSYDRCISGIDCLRSAGITPIIKTTLTQQNVGELESMSRLTQAWGTPFYAGWLLSRRRDGAVCEIDHFRRSAEDCAALEAITRQSTDGGGQIGEAEATGQSNDAFYCQAGKNSFVISPGGAMNVCIDLPLPAAQPLSCGFQHAWQEVGDFISSVPRSPVCDSCALQTECPRCPAWSFVEAGNFIDPVPYLCDLAKERARYHALRIIS